MILCRFILVFGVILLGQPATAHLPKRNDSRGFMISPDFDTMTTFLLTDAPVYHIEPDLYIHGNILFAEFCAIKTTDGTTTTTIAGHNTICGFYDGIGNLTRFNLIWGFRQISPAEVVIGDYRNSCLRLLNRITLNTSLYAGTCKKRGFTDGTSDAKFSYILKLIDDIKHPGMLLVAQQYRIRHVNKLSAESPHPVSTFYSSNWYLQWPRSLIQDPITGNLYINDYHNVIELSYSNKSVTVLAGRKGSRGNRDCNFSLSLFNGPHDIIMISKNMIILADTYNHKLRLMNLDTRTVTSLCSSVKGSADGDMKSCQLQEPYTLTVLNDTLYVGEYKGIRKIQDNRITACSKPVIRKVASAETGVASVDVPLLAGMFNVDLTPGTYPTKIASDKANCTINIRVLDAFVKRRLVMESHYNVSCDSATRRGLLEFQGLSQFVDVTYRQLDDVCHPDCSRAQIDVMLTCEVNILTVIWPTDTVYDGAVVNIPEDLEERLNEKIEAKGAAFYLYIQGHTPPFVYPNKEDNGGYVIPSIYSYCENESYVYNKQKDACEKSVS